MYVVMGFFLSVEQETDSAQANHSSKSLKRLKRQKTTSRAKEKKNTERNNAVNYIANVDDKYIALRVQECLNKLSADIRRVDVAALKQICRAENIRLLPYSSQATKALLKVLCLEDHAVDNCAFCIGNIVFWDDDRADECQRTDIAHELGHVLLGHTAFGREALKTGSCEMQADSFAFRLLFGIT